MDRGRGFCINQRHRGHSVHLEKNIVCWFCIPLTIISDNRPQFDSRVYRNLCQELKIKNLYSTLRYPQSNGQAEASNKILLIALKKRLDAAKGKMGRRTSRGPLGLQNDRRKTNWYIPFALTYGIEAIIPTKIGMPTLRTNMLE